MKFSRFFAAHRGALLTSACLLVVSSGFASGQTETPTASDETETPALALDNDETLIAPGNDAGNDDGSATTNEAPLGTAESQDNLPAPGSEAGLLALQEQIGECYTGDPAIPLSEEVGIRFVLDSAGLLKGIPEHVDQGVESSSRRRVFLNAMLALEDCAPYAVGGAETTYVATFSPMEVATLNAADAPVNTTPQEIEPNATARVDPEQSTIRGMSLATDDTEASLGLSRSDRREIQNRLRLVDHDPGGADGVFGPNTRVAIASWQVAQGFPDTGYLNEPQMIALKEQSDTAYQAFRNSQPRNDAPRQGERVRVCKRGVLGILYDCRYTWR